MDPEVATVIVAAFGIVGTVLNGVLSGRSARAAAEEETERLRLQHQEDERQHRQGTYHRTLAAFNAMDAWARNLSATIEEYEAISAEFTFLHGGCHLFGDQDVIDAFDPITELLYMGANEPEALPGEPQVERWRRGYKRYRNQLIAAQGDLVRAMRADVTGE